MVYIIVSVYPIYRITSAPYASEKIFTFAFLISDFKNPLSDLLISIQAVFCGDSGRSHLDQIALTPGVSEKIFRFTFVISNVKNPMPSF